MSEIIDEATTSWAERVRELLVDEVGVAEAQRVMSGVGAAAPARFSERSRSPLAICVESTS